MRKRPWALIGYSSLMAITAFGFPIQLIFLQDLSSTSLSEIWSHLSDLNILTMIACLMAAKYSFDASSNIFIVAPVSVVIMGLNNWWVGHVALDYSMLQTSLGTIVFFAVNSLLFHKDALLVLSKQNLRWWRTSIRKETRMPVAIHPWVGPSIQSVTKNISKTGILVSSNDLGGMSVGDRVQMRLNVDGHHNIRCTALLVRYAESDKNHFSAAFQFEDLEKEDRRNLEHFIDTLGSNKYENVLHPQ